LNSENNSLDAPTYAAALAADPEPSDWLAILLDCDDETLSAHLITCITTGPLGRHTALLQDARVMGRLCALEDALFIHTLLTLAETEHAGPTLLFEEDIMHRVARLRSADFHGAFLTGLQARAGRDLVARYQRELRPWLLRQRLQQAGDRAFTPLTGAALLAKDIPDLEFIVEEILPVGATLFVGRAKDGKSLAVWNLCLAVASGGVVFGRYPTTPGPVLYLALEDGERRAKKRLQDQMRALHMATCPEGFELVCWDAPRVGEGLEEHLHGWLDTHPGAKLIVIDILEKVRPPRTRNGSVYADDYAAVAPLQRLAQDRGIAIVIVHHTHKAKVDDFRDTPSGSISLLGAVDTLWSLRRVAGETDAVLQITGRDLLEMPDLAMEFKDGFWTARGDAATTVLNPAHQAILDTLRTAGYPMTPTQLATVLGANLNTMKVHLMRLTERGLVVKNGQGQYMHRITTPERPESVATVTPVTCIPVEEDKPTPPIATVEDDGIRITPLMSTCSETEATVPPGGDTVTAVTPDTPQAQTSMRPATNGHTNGHHADTPQPQQPDPYCPGCGAMTCWLDRGHYYQCAERRCGWKVIKAGNGQDR
jgi:hypothetical protein